MKKILLTVLSVFFALCSACVFVACSDDSGNSHKHEYSDTYTYDAEFHWYECACGEKKSTERHVFVEGVCACGYEKQNNGESTTNPDNPTHAHEYSSDYISDGDKHWKECACGDIAEEEKHSGGTATCKEKAICEICNSRYGELKPHEYSVIKRDELKHWLECSGCGSVKEYVVHTFTNGKCDCGYEKSSVEGGTPEHRESDWIIDVKPTCVQKGLRYKKCLDCLAVVAVEEMETTDHAYANINKDGTHHWYECDCGRTLGKQEHEFVTTALSREDSLNPCVSSWYSSVTKCLFCDYEVKQTVFATGHSYKNITVGKQPSESECGYLIGTCSTCIENGFDGENLKVVDLPKLSEQNLSRYYQKSFSVKNNDECNMLGYIYKYKGIDYFTDTF